MDKTISECGVTIVNQKYLMASDGTFITRDVYKSNCSMTCSFKSTCGIVLDLLAKGKYNEALQTLKNKNYGV